MTMVRLSRLFIRTALVYLLIGVTLGTWMLIGKAFGNYDSYAYLGVHMEVLLVGWFFQLVLGVSYWILPRRLADNIRVRPELAWGAYVMVNAGIITVSIASIRDDPTGLFFGRLMELLAAIMYVIHIRPRLIDYLATEGGTTEGPRKLSTHAE